MARCPSCGRRGREGHDACPPRAQPGPRHAQPPEVPGLIVGELLGAGGFSTVWAATRGGQQGALKAAPPEGLEQLRNEARALALVGPPAVPALLGEGALPGGGGYLLLERIDAPTLAQLMEDAAGAFPAPEAVQLTLAVLDALAALHARGVAHLDLKPENVFMKDGAARLFDLGLARQGAAQPAAAGAGTPEYISPEQCEGRPAGPAADVYAAGIILYELLAGRPPFIGAAAPVRQAHLGERPQLPSSFAPVPAALEQLILRCLAKAPEARFSSAGELLAALRAVPLDSAGPARAAAPAAPAAPAQRPVAAVFFSSPAPARAVQALLDGFGGVVAHAQRGRYSALFEGGDHPLQRASRASSALIEQGLSSRATLDLISATALGPRRFLSGAFSEEERWPRPDDPEGALATAAAAGLLAETPWSPVRDGLLRHEPTRGEGEPTRPQAGHWPLVGREPLLAELISGAHFATEGRPAIELISGDAGLGKSRLGATLRERLGTLLPGCAVIEIRVPEPLAGDASQALRALAAHAFSLPAGVSAARCAERVRALLPGSLPDDALAVALAAGALQPGDPSLHALSAAPGALRARTVRTLGEALRRRAADGLLCVILDDAQFADDTALDALEYAALAEGRARLWIVALARPAFERARPSFGERAAWRRSHRLDALPRAEAGKLCRTLLEPASDVPEAAVQKLVGRAQGVPLLLVELIRALKREGVVRRRPRGESWYLATDELDRVPDLPLVDWVAHRELEALPPALQAHARLTALLGPEVFPEEIEGVLHELDLRFAAEALPLDGAVAGRRLVESGLLEKTRQGALRFRHAMAREAVVRSTPAPLRRAVHEAAAQFFRTAEGDRGLLLLALHTGESGQAAEAGKLYLRLARLAETRQAWLEAEATHSRALALLPEDARADRLLARRGRAAMRYRLGRYDDSLGDFAEARLLARALGDVRAEAELLLEEATALDWLNDYASAAARLGEAEALLGGGELSAVTRAQLLVARGRALFRAGRLQEAAAALEQAAAAADALGEAAYEPLVISLILLETVLPGLGRAAEAEAAGERAAALSRARGDQLHLASALNNRRNLLVARKDLTQALEDQHAFIRIGRELGLVMMEYAGEYNLGELHCSAGDAAPATQHAQRAMELERAHPEVGARPLGALLLARVLVFDGQLDRAGAVLRELRAETTRAADQGRPGGALSAPEEVLAEAVELSLRGAPEADWTPLLARSAECSVEQEPLEVLDLCARSARRSGRLEEAARIFNRAGALAATLPNVFESRLAQQRN